MKKFYALIIMLSMTLLSYAQVTVTLNLDMTGTDYDESLEDLYYSGDVICPWGDESGLGWAEPGTKSELKFTDNGDGTFTLVLNDIDPGYYYMDFYRENEDGHGWGTNGEWSGAPLGIDQLLFVGYQDVVFNSKWDDYHLMTLHVDMNNVGDFDPATDTVYYMDGGYTRLHGTIMTDVDEDGIYTFEDDSIPQCYTRAVFGYGELQGDTVICEWSDEELNNRITLMESEDIEKTYVFGNSVAVGIAIRELESVKVKMYPNPSTGIFNIELDGMYDVILLDISGKIVYSGIIDSNGIVDISDKAPGLYLARFQSGNKIAVKKLLKK